MKSKDKYLLTCGRVNGAAFRADLLSEARERHVSMAKVFREFIDKELLIKREIGEFGLNVFESGSLSDGAIAIYYALGITDAEAATKHRILEDYIHVSQTDQGIWATSWYIDELMNWPHGTSLAASLPKTAPVAA